MNQSSLYIRFYVLEQYTFTHHLIRLLRPSFFLQEPWRSELPADNRDIETLEAQYGGSIVNRDIELSKAPCGGYRARSLKYSDYREQEDISQRWCFKMQWGLDSPELDRPENQKFKPRGLVLQQILRLCIQIHSIPFYSHLYRNPAHWFAEIMADFDDINRREIFSEPERNRGKKRDEIKKCRQECAALKDGRNPYTEMHNFQELINLALDHGGIDSEQPVPDVVSVFRDFVKALSAYVTYRDRSPDIRDLFISGRHLRAQDGKSSSSKFPAIEFERFLEANKKALISEKLTVQGLYDLLRKTDLPKIRA
jgi:hypothetical protein